jgi:hypothetical protein
MDDKQRPDEYYVEEIKRRVDEINEMVLAAAKQDVQTQFEVLEFRILGGVDCHNLTVNFAKKLY